MNDAVKPDHYKLTVNGVEIQCIDVIEALGLGFNLGSALKYAWRFGRKHDRLDEEIGKCRWYLDRWHKAEFASSARPFAVREIWLAVNMLVRVRTHDGRELTLGNDHAQLVGNLRAFCMIAEQHAQSGERLDSMPYMRELIALFDLERMLCGE
jgi:hypothetical protein